MAKKGDQLRELSNQHQWTACLAMQKAFSNDMGQRQGVDWSLLCEAAFHAGSAYALHKARDIIGE